MIPNHIPITIQTRIPPEVLDEQWYGFVHKLIEKMQIAYREAQRENPLLNQKTIAERLGRKASFISRCLSGQMNMTIRTIHDLARGMNCRVDVFFTPLRSVPAAHQDYRIDLLPPIDPKGPIQRPANAPDPTINKIVELT